MAGKQKSTSSKRTPLEEEDDIGDVGDLGASEVAEKMNKEQEQGYVGTSPDPTPRDNYSVQGVLDENTHTPETDPDRFKDKPIDVAGHPGVRREGEGKFKNDPNR